MRSPLVEIAHLVAHKLKGTFANPKDAIREGDASRIKMALQGLRSCHIEGWISLQKSWLP